MVSPRFVEIVGVGSWWWSGVGSWWWAGVGRICVVGWFESMGLVVVWVVAGSVAGWVDFAFGCVCLPIFFFWVFLWVWWLWGW